MAVVTVEAVTVGKRVITAVLKAVVVVDAKENEDDWR